MVPLLSSTETLPIKATTMRTSPPPNPHPIPTPHLPTTLYPPAALHRPPQPPLQTHHHQAPPLGRDPLVLQPDFRAQGIRNDCDRFPRYAGGSGWGFRADFVDEGDERDPGQHRAAGGALHLVPLPLKAKEMKVLYDYAKTRYVAVLGLEGGDDEEDTETLRGRIESMIVQGPELFSRALARRGDPEVLAHYGEDSYPEIRPRIYFEGDDVPERLSGGWVIAHGGKVEMMSGTNNTSGL
ncbi:MAG: hypothetical protein Q9195_006034 [Heterodermia aff. obscurata]